MCTARMTTPARQKRYLKEASWRQGASGQGGSGAGSLPPDSTTPGSVKATNTIVSQCALHHFQYTSQQTYAYPAYAPQPTQPMAGPQTSVATSTTALPAAPMSVSPVNGEANV